MQKSDQVPRDISKSNGNDLEWFGTENKAKARGKQQYVKLLGRNKKVHLRTNCKITHTIYLA